MKTIKKIGEEIFALKSALIFCHTRPDGDTLGSAGALYYAMKSKGIDCDIVCDTDIPEKFSFMPIFSKVLKPEEVNKKYEGNIAVDVATDSLLGRAWGLFNGSEKRFCIDHHISNDRYVKKGSYIKDRAANAMNIFDLLSVLEIKITPDIATCILLGIVTDTNNFANNNTDEKALSYAGKAVACGGRLKDVNVNIYKNQPKERALLYIATMQKMRFYLDNKLAIIAITKDMIDKYKVSDDVTEGFVEFPISIKGVEVAASLLQTKDELYKVSFRSKGKIDVNKVAGEFGGGGHVLASGCAVSGLFEEVIEKIVRAVDINM